MSLEAASGATVYVSSGVSIVAAKLSLDGANLGITDPDGFQIGTVNGLSGITLGSNGATATLTVGNGGPTSVTQAPGANIIASGLRFSDAGQTTFTLNNSGNNVARISGTGAAISYTDADTLNVFGISATAGDLSLTTLAGDLALGVANTLAPVNAPAGKITLTAGAAGSDFAVLAGNGADAATVDADGDILLKADHLSINAPITSANGKVIVAPFESGTTIDLGGTNGAGVLGISQDALDHLVPTAGALQIGEIGASNPITVSGAIAPTTSTSLVLGAGNVTGAGTITVAKLAVISSGTLNLTGANDVDTMSFASTGGAGTNAFSDADGFALGDAAGYNNFQQTGINVTTLDVGAATVTLPTGTIASFKINGSTAGTGYSQLAVNGTVNLTGATLSLTTGGSVPTGTEFVLISNDGSDDVTGTFDGLDEGDAVPGFSPQATITYHGGDGNDVAIVTVDPLSGNPSPNGKSFTFRDVDGDIVTITATKGTFTGTEVVGVSTGGPNGAAAFQKLKLGSGFAGANITITAKPSTDGGNGFVNLGWLDATGVDLGTVTIAGDVSRITAGSDSGDPRIAAIKSLTVQSVGLLGDASLPASEAGGFVGVNLRGSLPKLSIKDDLRGSVMADHNSTIGTITIGGSMVGFGDIFAESGINQIKIAGDIRAAGGTVQILTFGPMGTITVDGSVRGAEASNLVEIGGFGQLAAPTNEQTRRSRASTSKAALSFSASTRAGWGC